MAKDSPRTTAGELQKNCSWSLWVRKPKKVVKQHLHHHMLFVRASRKKIKKGKCKKNKTISSIFSGTDGTSFYGH